MKAVYKIIKVDNSAVVLINDSSRITDVITNVETAIKKKKYFGVVIFDLLLSNGIYNRFFQIPFENESFVVNKIQKVSLPDKKIINKANKHYLENLKFINNAIISRLEKNAILKALNTAMPNTDPTLHVG